MNSKLQFPSEITSTKLCLDIDVVYADLTLECRETGQKIITCPVEVKCHSFIGTLVWLVRDIKVRRKVA